MVFQCGPQTSSNNIIMASSSHISHKYQTRETNMQTFFTQVSHLVIPNNITPEKNLLTDLFGLSNILWDHFGNTCTSS